MTGDFEIEVMAKSYDLIKNLEDAEKRRVIQWLVNKFDLLSSTAFQSTIQKLDEQSLEGSHPVAVSRVFEAPAQKVKVAEPRKLPPPVAKQVVMPELTGYSVMGLFDRVHTKTDVARVLLVGAYLQAEGNDVELGSRQINKELKNIGRGIKNITQAINSLLKKEPKLLKMTRKTTNSQQGKKKYVVTPLGMEKVKESLKTGVLKI